MRVLLVDDQAQSLALLTQILKEYWQEVAIFRALSAAVALEILSQQAVDLIISDWYMPDINGLTLITKVKEQYPAIPVILISGIQISPGDMREAFATGAWDYLRKPFEAVEVVARVENVLRLSRAYGDIARLNENNHVVFNTLSNHLVVGAQRASLAMDLIQRHLPVKTDYLARLLSETYQNQQNNQTLLQGLLQWSQLQFETLQPHVQAFDLRAFLERWAGANTDREIQLRVNAQLKVVADPQVLQEVLHKLVQRFPLGKVRLKAEAEGSLIQLSLRSAVLSPSKTFAPWPEHFAESNLSREELIHYLYMHSCQLQLKAMRGDLSVQVSKRDQTPSLMLTLPGACKI